MSAHFLQPCLETPDATWSLRNLSTDTVVAATLVRAFDRKTRNVGLLGQHELPQDTALVLAPCSAVHTWFMRFAIDVLFLSRDGRVLAARRSLNPWRIAIRVGAFATVELSAGSSTSTEVGHLLGIAKRAEV